MRVPIQYVALVLSSSLGYSTSGPPSVEVVEVAPLGVTASPSYWASSSGVGASYGPINDL